MNSFTYNGINSLALGLRIEKKDVYSAPKKEITFQEIPGRDGDLIIPGGRYPNGEVVYTVFLPAKSQEELAQKITAVKNWLYSDQDSYHVLTDTYNTGFYRKAVYASKLDIEDELNKIGTCKIKFSCKPYRYDVTGDTTTTFSTSGRTITNPYPFDSKPYMKISCTGNGSITLTNGDRTNTWRLTGSNNFTEVDSDIMSWYKGAMNKNSIVSGNGFPIFHAGTTTITFDGSITSVEIKPRWVTV